MCENSRLCYIKFNADVAQRQSSSLVMSRSRVRFPSSAFNKIKYFEGLRPLPKNLPRCQKQGKIDNYDTLLQEKCRKFSSLCIPPESALSLRPQPLEALLKVLFPVVLERLVPQEVLRVLRVQAVEPFDHLFSHRTG